MPRAQKRTEHVYVQASDFRQVLVDDYFWMDDGDRFRIVFGTHSAQSKKPNTHVVLLTAEVGLSRDDARGIADSINKWLKKGLKKDSAQEGTR